MYSLNKEKVLLSTWKTVIAFVVIMTAIQFTIFTPQKVHATSYNEDVNQIKPIEVTPVIPVNPIEVTPVIPVTPIEVTPVIPVKPNEVTPIKPKFLQIISTNDNINYTKQDLFCMAKNIYHEAGSEPLTGKYAVAQVTINRMKSPQFANTVCSVVFQPYQFSWAIQHSRRWSTPKGKSWAEANRIAHDVLANNKRVHGLSGALFFHATHVRPRWASRKNELARIGLHIFYGPRSKNGRA